MTTKFLEIEFNHSDNDKLSGIPPEIIRIKVDTNVEANQLYNKLPVEIRKHKHSAKIHTCNHSRTGNKPCTTNTFSEVK